MRLIQHFISDIVLKISVFMPYFRQFFVHFSATATIIRYVYVIVKNQQTIYRHYIIYRFIYYGAAFLLIMAQPVWQANTGKNKLFGDGDFVLLFIALVVYKFKAV